MTERVFFTPLLLSLPLIYSLAATGCATSSDLEKLDKRLAQQLQTMDAGTQSQIGELRTELGEVRAAQDTLNENIDHAAAEMRADTKAVVEVVKQSEVSRARMQEKLRQIADSTDRINSQMEVSQRRVLQALLDNYKAEEAALRERLKAVVETRQQLESTTGATEVETPAEPKPSDDVTLVRPSVAQ